jgi:hypothetical protein
MKYNKGGTNPQGQIQLILQRADGTYYIKSNSITSFAFPTTKDAVIYTKASIYKITNAGALVSIDGNVTLRLDAHDGCTTVNGCTSGGDTIGFTVLSSKDSALYYSNNWVFDSGVLGWRTVPYATPGDSAAAIN